VKRRFLVTLTLSGAQSPTMLKILMQVMEFFDALKSEDAILDYGISLEPDDGPWHPDHVVTLRTAGEAVK